ncbi:hypothetical protein Rhe02_10510 [Rhizocola hellebori]|uniref:Uncharacterized protein n=1 Tax=Rhizocola hellebori TaxID=1392758 RepID=A0A8J3Q3C7_9ACTN|nr:hypothetical protein [Rhizocola hellebori]GIH02984.1 hypothetical protein Rhe02_10510 [Rhizocola hellebori]
MRIRAALTAAGLAAAATMAVVLPTGSPAFAALSCPDNNWSIKDGREGNFFAGTNINIRTGPSTTCPAAVPGQFGQPSHWVQVDCWQNAGVGQGSWTHLFDFTNGVEGWSKDTLLVGQGAHVRC